MKVYRVIYGAGDVCGGYNQAIVVANNIDHIQGMLFEQEGDEVFITLVEVTTVDASVYKSEQVLSVNIA